MYDYTIGYNGNYLKLTGTEKQWQLLSVSGLNPSKATLSESDVVGSPGVKIVGSKIDKRAIVFTIRVNHPCELNRSKLLEFLTPGNEISINIKTRLKEATINGVVETNEYEIYTNNQTMQVSVLCEYPYFKLKSSERITYSVESVGGFQFPLNVAYDKTVTFDDLNILDKLYIYNYGQITTGLELELEFYDTVINPKIYNVDNPNEFFGLRGTYVPGDVIKINTNALAKDKVTLISGGTSTKALKKLMRDSTWLKVRGILVLGVSAIDNEGAEIKGKAYLTVKNHDELKGI